MTYARMIIAAAFAITLLLAAAANAKTNFPDPELRPLRQWSMSETTTEGLGFTQVAGAIQQGGRLSVAHDFGGTLFDQDVSCVFFNRRRCNRLETPDGFPRDGLATGRIFSSASGQTFKLSTQAPTPSNVNDPDARIGNRVVLDQWQAFEKDEPNAKLRFKITDAVLAAADLNGNVLLPSECPSGKDLRCQDVMEAQLDFEASAYTGDGHIFFASGRAFLNGWSEHFKFDAFTTSRSQSPLWNTDDFEFVPGFSFPFAFARLASARTFAVDLSSLDVGRQVVLHVRTTATVRDRRGRESAVQARFQDPQEAPQLVDASGVHRVDPTTIPEPPLEAPVPAQCSNGADPAAGTLQFSAPEYAMGEWAGAAVPVVVTRAGGSVGEVSAALTTSDGTATAGSDYDAQTTTIAFGDGDTAPRVVEFPIRQDADAEDDETINLALLDPSCTTLGEQASTVLTIADDDTPVEEPPAFTIGGTVSGLEGTGLVLDDLGTRLTVDANGPFTLPGTRADGLPYDVQVATQPGNPDQVCTVTNGAGTIVLADVTDVAIDCTTPPAFGLDETFGAGGKVSTVVGAGQGQAVLIQPDGGIVTVGRSIQNGSVDFTLTRHDADGNPDTSFGDGGIARANIGPNDEATDAALQPDGKIVVVGRTDGPGANRNFAVARFTPDGELDDEFGGGDGVVTLDFAGRADQANAVAVRPDGTILVAGQAMPADFDSDFALAIYEPDGTLRRIATTDLGTTTDLGRAIAVQPSGAIVIAGTVDDDDIALARYTEDGELDGAFGDQQGFVISDFGSTEFANGITLQPDGHIVVAGHALGSDLTTDFALVRFSADGALDTTFGDGGIVTTAIGSGDDFGENVTTLAGGELAVVGRSTSATILDMAVARYGADGAFKDAVTADFHGKGEFGQDIAAQADGKLIAAGFTANGFDTEFALIRVNP